MAAVKIDKVVSTLPDTLTPNTVYAVRVGVGFDLYISDVTGTTAHPLNAPAGDPADPIATASSVASAASGSTLGLEQNLLASTGQIGKTLLAVPYVFYEGSEGPSPNHKAQVTSLGAGNVLFVYATGPDFFAGVIQEGPVFLGDGEVYVVENVQAGSILNFTEGGYGFAQQRNGNDESPMPLMSFALAFKDGFAYAFRNSQTYAAGGDTDNQGFIHIVNGPLPGSVTLFNDSGEVVEGQENLPLIAGQYQRLYTAGNGEYRITATNLVMAAINANMGVSTPRFYDARLVPPVSNKIGSWPRSGFLSALYNGTVLRNYVNDLTGSGASPTITINPGTPLDWDAAGTTGASDTDYEPRGATICEADGLVCGYSGADTSGLEATPACPTSTFTQKLALPLKIALAGDGGNNGIAILSEFTGTARVKQWNPITREAELVSFTAPDGTTGVTEIKLIRRNGSTAEFLATTPAHQKHPASALISAQGGPGGADSGAYDMTSTFTGGYIEIDVPAMVVFNSEQNANGATTDTFRGTSGSAVVGIHSDDDEQLTYGITPDAIRAEIRRDAAGMLRRRDISAIGTETWNLA